MSSYEGFAPVYDARAADMTEALSGRFDRRAVDESSRELARIARKPA